MKTNVKYPVGEQSFEQLRRDGFLYVDKTRYIEKIINSNKYYFLGRPRRFGKSLFLSTLKCFFEGKRELFTGLDISACGWKWEKYPVLYLDLNNQGYKKDNDLDVLLNGFLARYEEQYEIEPTSDNHSERLSGLIKTCKEKTGLDVVILIDEYDKPLVNNIHDRQRFESYRNKLSTLYSNFKSSADYIRLVFMTGVSRFGKLSVFSGLNNISDISFDNNYSAVCGITQEELLDNFQVGIKELGSSLGYSEEQTLTELKRRYDGYHFTSSCPDIYNPFSLLSVFSQNRFNNFWIESGTPTLLLEQLKKTDADLVKLLNAKSDHTELSGLDIENITPVSLFYQTGYLTIKGYNEKRDIYQLGMPNEEVTEGFLKFILPAYANLHQEASKVVISYMLDDLEDGNVESLMRRIQSLFAGVSHDMHIERERDVQNTLLILFRLIGLSVEVEYKTSDGRIDILVRTDKYVYLMELKYNSTAEEALEQIERKEYALPWATDSRKVIAIGINFSSEKRRIDSWTSKEL